MKVLLVSNIDAAHPFGQHLRPFHLGSGLARAGVEVGMVGVDGSSVDFGPAWSTGRKQVRPYAGALRQAARAFRPDVVYGHEARGGAAAILAATGLPVVADFHAMPSLEWRGFARRAHGAQAARLHGAAARSFAAERLMARRADGLIAAGQEVADDVRRLHRPRADPVVVVNGFTPALADDRAAGDAPPFAAGNGHRSAVVTLPSADHQANTRAMTFLQQVAERLTADGTGVTVHVLGSDDGPPAPGLTYEGFVPALAPWLAHADVCLLPYPPEAALAGGPRIKLVEYLSAGRAIVTTQEGLRGLREVERWPGVRVAGDDPAAFAAAVAAAAHDDGPGLAAKRAEVRERLTWDALARDAARVLEEAAAR